MPTSHDEPQQQRRRILEKSRTVRRRYQRSNKRFEFSASQIQRIEREEERERKAKRLREQEKRKLANRKRKAEKEAKEREERKRSGCPESNTSRIPASQPLLVNFFGVKHNKTDEEGGKEELQESEDSEDSEDSKEDIETSEDDVMKDLGISPRENITNAPPPQQVGEEASTVTEEFSDIETELGDDWLDDIDTEEHIAPNESTKQNAHESLLNTFDVGISSSTIIHGDDQPTILAQDTDDRSIGTKGLGDSFEDDTALLLQSLDPSVLQTFETLWQQKLILHDQSEAVNNPSTSKAIQLAGSENESKYPHFMLEKSIGYDVNTNVTLGGYTKLHTEEEDEFDDLPLSTQDVRDLDDLIGLG